MDLLLDFLLTMTGLRLVFEAVAVVVLTLAVVSAVAVIAALWYQAERFHVLTGRSDSHWTSC